MLSKVPGMLDLIVTAVLQAPVFAVFALLWPAAWLTDRYSAVLKQFGVPRGPRRRRGST